jgi:tRNA (cmo5U34)-methyltransferase
MSLEDTDTDQPVHIPTDPNKFEFDEEVATVFDNMAIRSIPMYHTARELSLDIVVNYIKSIWAEGRVVRIVDVGASTGAFFRDLWKRLGYPHNHPIVDLQPIAIDSSQPMLDILSKRMPQVECLCIDAVDIATHVERVDIVVMAYVMQFMCPGSRWSFLKSVNHCMNKDGLVIASQKDEIYGRFASHFDESYIEFRKANGYTVEEIEAKTAALENSMWPQVISQTKYDLQSAGFKDITDLCRWLQFSTVVALKG